MKQGKKAVEWTNSDNQLIVEFYAELTQDELVTLLDDVGIKYRYCVTMAHYNIALVELAYGWQSSTSRLDEFRQVVQVLKAKINSGAFVHVMEISTDGYGILMFSIPTTYQVLSKNVP